MLAQRRKEDKLITSKEKDNLREYVNLVISANKNFNLISRKTEADIWTRHVNDSPQLIDFIPVKTKI